jgi:alpha-L-fucosidase
MVRAFFVLLSLVLVSCAREVSPPAPVYPIPSAHQLAWHELEQYAFIHFTTNTFTDKEWGYGDESASVFSPSTFDAEQWVSVLKSAGLRGLILTCKHHDGFCLWPSGYTSHSVKFSPFRDGKGDVVREVSEACHRHGLLFGIYLSPWDRNHAKYGTAEYLEYYRTQLTELLTGYGPIFEIWFDGANGGDGYYGGVRELRKIDNRSYYNWHTTHTLVRELMPDALMFSDAGPDIRWCGNERGISGETNWSMLHIDTLYPGQAGIEGLLNVGSETGDSWVPSEVDVSIRPGWFYHASEDDRVRTPEDLLRIYLQSVGRGSNLLLNIPPDHRGLIHERDVASLLGWRSLLDSIFAYDLALESEITSDSHRGNSPDYTAAKTIDGDASTYWSTDDNVLTGTLTLSWHEPQQISYITLCEPIQLGQRIKSFVIEASIADTWVEIASGTTIGHKRILPLESAIGTTSIRIWITDSRACPLLSKIAVY